MPIFGSSHIQLNTKLMLAQSLILSRALYAVAASRGQLEKKASSRSRLSTTASGAGTNGTMRHGKQAAASPFVSKDPLLPCPTYGKQCKGAKGLAAHQRHAHGVKIQDMLAADLRMLQHSATREPGANFAPELYFLRWAAGRGLKARHLKAQGADGSPRRGVSRLECGKFRIPWQASLDLACDSLLGLDSLRILKLSSALRSEAGVRLPLAAVRRCATLGALLAEISRAAAAKPSEDARAAGGPQDAAAGLPDGPPGRERAAWGLMWEQRCAWTFCRDRPLAEATLREALAELARRHPALRAELADPLELFTATQQALAALAMRQRHGRGGKPHEARRQAPLGAVTAALERGAASAARWGFRQAWPRLRVRAETGVPLRVLPPAATKQDAEQTLRWQRFQPPWQAFLVSFGAGDSEDAEGALVHIMVSHMLSDGASGMPIFADLAQIVAALEDPTRALPPPPPCALAALEARVLRMIAASTTAASDLTGHQHGEITHEPIGNAAGYCERQPDTTILTIPQDVTAAFRARARALTVSDEAMVLALLGAVLSRFLRTPEVCMSVVVAQRDGPGESEMLGLFADIRMVHLRVAELSYAGMALWMHHVVQERLWHPQAIASQYQTPLVNIEWQDFERHAGFAHQVYLKQGFEWLSHPIKVSLDQPGPDSFRLRVVIDRALYGAEEQDRFTALLEDPEAFAALLISPLQAVWPSEHAPAAPA
ncbi:unnamed protein product [Prorocentrum cordatum]|uniref:Carrier domain-containing protein n=1 Tax=Prorocentrum cordatum TaxID=2364126 RepID=A0ABN9RNK9_9DINO|nr:unnamed protein product [Polarella glacialis]